MGSYARFEHYLTTLELETCPEFWPPSPVSGPLWGAGPGRATPRRILPILPPIALRISTGLAVVVLPTRAHARPCLSTLLFRILY